MATEWYLMGSKPVYNSGFEKEEFDAYAKDSFSELLDSSPISKTVKIINHDLSVISEIKAFIQNNTSDSINQDDIRQILTVIGTLQCGYYILFENNVWLITSFVGNNGMNEKAIMQLCNYSIIYQSKINGTILSYPSIKKTTNTVGIDENKTISTGDSVVSIELPFDEETKLIDVDDRFFIDDLTVPKPLVYGVSKPDRTSTQGIIKLTMKQGSYDENVDDKELGICNYYSPNTPTIPEGNTYSEISIGGNLTIGAERTITAKAYNADKTENNSVILIWDVVYPVGLESHFTKLINGNTCKIKIVDEDYDTLDSVVNISVDDGNGGYTGRKSFVVGV